MMTDNHSLLKDEKSTRSELFKLRHWMLQMAQTSVRMRRQNEHARGQELHPEGLLQGVQPALANHLMQVHLLSRLACKSLWCTANSKFDPESVNFGIWLGSLKS